LNGGNSLHRTGLWFCFVLFGFLTLSGPGRGTIS